MKILVRNHSIKHLVYAGSSSVYGLPGEYYKIPALTVT